MHNAYSRWPELAPAPWGEHELMSNIGFDQEFWYVIISCQPDNPYVLTVGVLACEEDAKRWAEHFIATGEELPDLKDNAQ